MADIKEGQLLPETDSEVTAHDQVAEVAGLNSVTVIDREQDGLPESSLDIELGRLAGADAKRYGVQVVLQMAAAWAKETNANSIILGNKNSKLADELAVARIENASLKATNKEREKHRFLIMAAMALGPVILTFGLDQMSSSKWGVGIVAFLIGGCITTAAFLAQRKES